MDERMELKMSRLKTTGTAQDHRALLTVCRTRISHPPYFIHLSQYVLSEWDAPKYEMQNATSPRASQSISPTRVSCIYLNMVHLKGLHPNMKSKHMATARFSEFVTLARTPHMKTPHPSPMYE